MKLTITKLAAIISITILLASVNAMACGDDPGPCGKYTGWYDYETVRLSLQQGGASANYYLQSSSKNGDLQVDVDVSDPTFPQHGTVLMVEGITFASKGLTLTKGSEIDAIDVPLLSVILAKKVLGRALPDGPEAITKKKEIAHEDKKTGIKFATPSASGFIPPPWSVKGFVTPNPDGSIDFSLTLSWATKGTSNTSQTTTTSLSGQLQHNADFHIPDDMSLDGWTVFGVGPIVIKSKSSTTHDYGEQQAKATVKTIADIRKEIAIRQSPGTPDLSLNFAGFWKGKCSNNFGLRIKPVEQPGMYTVTFCGPGGCGDEQHERRTFITGDTLYRVISPTEIQMGPPDGSIYIKCSDKMLP